MFELKATPGQQPVLVNPKPMIPVRHLALTPSGWTRDLEQYGKEQDVRTFDVPDVDAAVSQLRAFPLYPSDGPLVYCVIRGKKPSVGAVILGTRVPPGWEPVPASRPYLQ